eukprot:CAMPEP_0117567652 /NCGR_PEP_ID=MMETSP0784-20121206/57718_1 /TAXON_ID=39447 /ORGANISM="" /LENGTH=77 /DNA_ID=CAMNT_0005365531 /DNA_START=109 /DNA_END=339 /DNA_ORIENTATION=-
MQIFARTLSGDTVALEVVANQSIDAVRRQLGTKVPLVYGGQVLQSSRLVAECHLDEGSTLHEVPRLRGGGDGTPAMG